MINILEELKKMDKSLDKINPEFVSVQDKEAYHQKVDQLTEDYKNNPGDNKKINADIKALKKQIKEIEKHSSQNVAAKDKSIRRLEAKVIWCKIFPWLKPRLYKELEEHRHVSDLRK